MNIDERIENREIAASVKQLSAEVKQLSAEVKQLSAEVKQTAADVKVLTRSILDPVTVARGHETRISHIDNQG